MEIARLIIGSLLALVGLGIDIAAFFVIVRVLWMWRPGRLLSTFNHAGTPLVELVVNRTTAWTARLNLKWPRPTRNQELAVSLLWLMVFRLAIGFLQALINSGKG